MTARPAYCTFRAYLGRTPYRADGAFEPLRRQLAEVAERAGAAPARGILRAHSGDLVNAAHQVDPLRILPRPQAGRSRRRI
jgi:hypothetical protein